jgi:adenine-specific DNA-methyltransferase
MQPPKLTRIARVLRKDDTWPEKLVWSWLRERRFSACKFRRQHPFGPHVLDFFCVETFLDIELDGSQHGHPEQRQKDEERDAWLDVRGVKVLRFWNSRLRREKDAIRDTIWRTLQERATHPLPEYCRPMSEESATVNQSGGDK